MTKLELIAEYESLRDKYRKDAQEYEDVQMIAQKSMLAMVYQRVLLDLERLE